jgi:hypothetical protein
MRKWQIILFLFVGSARANEIAPEWKEWIKKYASSNPIVAMNKNYSEELRITDEQLKAVLAGKSITHFKFPLKLYGKEVKSFDLLQDSSSRNFGSADWFDIAEADNLGTREAWRRADRMKEMLKNMEALLLNRPADQLAIVDMGGMHGEDVFFDFFLKSSEHSIQKKRGDILYFLSPVDLQTRRHHPTLEKLHQIQSGEKELNANVEYGSAALAAYFLGRFYYYRNLNSDLFTFEKIKAEPPAQLGVLVFLDYHGLNATQAFEDLPSATAVKRSGFKSIKIYTENFLFNKIYKPSEYEELVLITPAKLKKMKDENKAAIKYVNENQVIHFPAQYSLFQQLEKYQNAGLEVIFSGIEHFERLVDSEKLKDDEE